MSKDEAILFLLGVFRSRMAAASLATREKALQLTQDHQITALDLLQKYIEVVRNV